MIGGVNTNQILIANISGTNYFATAVPSVDFSYDSRYAAFGAYRSTASGPTGTNIVIYANPTNTTFSWASYLRLNATATTYMNLIRWHPSRYILATALIANSGDELYIAQFDGTTTTTTDSRAYSTGNAQAVAWHPSGNYLAVAKSLATGDTPYYVLVYEFNSTTSTLGTIVAQSANANLSGIQLKALDWDPTGNYLAAGRSASAYITILKFVPNANPDLGFTQIITPVPTTTLPGTVSSLRWHPTLANFIGVATSPTTNANKIRVLQFDPSTPAITNYALAAETVSSTAVSWGGCGNCLSAVYGDQGTPANNHRMFTFTQFPPTLVGSSRTETINASLSETRFDPSGQYFINTASNTGYGARRTMSSRCPVFTNHTFTDLTISLNNSLAISDCCITFSGNCSVIGRNNELSLASTCTLQIAPNATLELKNLTLTNLAGMHLTCLASTSTLRLNNTTFILDGDYTFSSGALSIINDVRIQGPGYRFLYASNQPCTIDTQSRLTLEDNVTFNYNPQMLTAHCLQFF
ncbi:MAG: hypothetical protein U1E13_09135, partial [Methylophilaceae bacterium]|nr:hypothetical protein [Methylophilaceae bacterium]